MYDIIVTDANVTIRGHWAHALIAIGHMREMQRETPIYALITGGLAAIGPFGALWLHGCGLRYDDIGLCLSVPLLMRLALFRPLAAWCEGFASAWTPVVMLCGVAVAASLVCALCRGPILMPVAWCGLSLAATACTPMMDGIILDASPERDCGDRLVSAKKVGALAYLLAVPIFGFCLQHIGSMSLPIWSAVVAFLACLSAARLVDTRTTLVNRWTGRISTASVENAGCPGAPGNLSTIMLAAAMLIEASHGAQPFAMVHWTASGITPEINGLLWATGTLADIGLLWLARDLLSRTTPSALLAIGGVAAILRWIGFALDPPLLALFLLQALHALSFTATCLSTVRLAHLWTARSGSARQLLVWATSTGFAGGIAVLGVAPLFNAIGMRTYWIMALLAGAGLIAALYLHLGLRGFVDAPHTRSHRGRVALRR